MKLDIDNGQLTTVRTPVILGDAKRQKRHLDRYKNSKMCRHIGIILVRDCQIYEPWQYYRNSHTSNSSFPHSAQQTWTTTSRYKADNPYCSVVGRGTLPGRWHPDTARWRGQQRQRPASSRGGRLRLTLKLHNSERMITTPSGSRNCDRMDGHTGPFYRVQPQD